MNSALVGTVGVVIIALVLDAAPAPARPLTISKGIRVGHDCRPTASRRAPREISGAEIKLDNVVKKYAGQKAAAVDDLSLTIPAGEIVMFVGPSGCGKTTSLKMINRLIEPTSGMITIDGEDVRQQQRRRACAATSATSSRAAACSRT